MKKSGKTFRGVLNSEGIRGAHSFEVHECTCGVSACEVFYIFLCDEHDRKFAYMSLSLSQSADIYCQIKGKLEERGRGLAS
jgi:hypothetical protein